jgi:hypothetical protein
MNSVSELLAADGSHAERPLRGEGGLSHDFENAGGTSGQG